MFTNQNRARSEARRLVVLLYVAIISFAAACAATPTRESTGGYVDDATSTAKIKADLLQDNKLTASDVHVKTYKGVVDLSGFVNRESDISEAGIVAGRVSGVTSVHNNLIVKGVVAPPTAAEKRIE
jgi:osmotically-inducible protein OsmY